MNLIEQIKVNDVTIDGYQGTYYSDNHEWLQVTTDSEDKILDGIKSDGTIYIGGDLQVDGDIINQSIKPVQETLSFFETIDDPEWLQVTMDSSGKILEGITKEGVRKFGILPPQIDSAIYNYINDYNKFPIDFGEPIIATSWLVVGDGNEGGRNQMCIAIGKKVLTNNTGIKNMTVGYDNMADCTGHDNTSMGYHALFRQTSGNNNAAFGSESQDDNTSGTDNAALGFCSLQRNNIGSGNVAFGAYALQGNYNDRFDPQNLKNFQKNVAIGYVSLYKSTTGTNSNVAIGAYTLQENKVYENCIAIGYNAQCSKNNQTVIGNVNTVETIVRGNFIVQANDGTKRQIIFNSDGTCSWLLVEE